MINEANLNVLHTAKTYRAARAAKRIFQMNGKRCKIYRSSGVYTKPSVGIASFCHYLVTEVQS